MDRLEKLVWVITGIVVAVVIVLAKVGPIRSDVSAEKVREDTERMNADNDFLKKARLAQQTHTRQQVNFVASHPTMQQDPRANAGQQPRGAAAGAPQGQQVADAGQQQLQMPPHPDGPGPIRPNLQIPPMQQNAPPVVPASNSAPVTVEDISIPNSAVEKYQHFEDLVELGNTADGQPVQYNGQDAFQINNIYDGSPLASQLGFQNGDVIVSVNGYPASMGNSRQLYETLKNERNFQVVIDRGGQLMTIPYHVR